MTSCIARNVVKAFSISLSYSTLLVSRKLAGSRQLLQVKLNTKMSCACINYFARAERNSVRHVRREISFANSDNFNFHETVKEKQK